MSNCGCSKCRRHSEFDAEAAYQKLNRNYTELADFVIRYMSEAKLERPERVEKAFAMAEQLTTIVGGTTTGEFPECCFVEGTDRCSGVLIHPKIVLTAGHCKNADFVGLNCRSRSDTNAERRFVLHRIPADNPSFDIQVLILQDAAKTKPALLARTQDIDQADDITVVGFGDSEFGTGDKRELPINIDPDPENVDFDSDTEFVAGGGACHGDSGGPAYITVNGKRKLAGLHSRSTGNNCQDGGIYTRVDFHIAFIRQVAQSFGIAFQA